MKNEIIAECIQEAKNGNREIKRDIPVLSDEGHRRAHRGETRDTDVEGGFPVLPVKTREPESRTSGPACAEIFRGDEGDKLFPGEGSLRGGRERDLSPGGERRKLPCGEKLNRCQGEGQGD